MAPMHSASVTYFFADTAASTASAPQAWSQPLASASQPLPSIVWAAPASASR